MGLCARFIACLSRDDKISGRISPFISFRDVLGRASSQLSASLSSKSLSNCNPSSNSVNGLVSTVRLTVGIVRIHTQRSWRANLQDIDHGLPGSDLTETM